MINVARPRLEIRVLEEQSLIGSNTCGQLSRVGRRGLSHRSVKKAVVYFPLVQITIFRVTMQMERKMGAGEQRDPKQDVADEEVERGCNLSVGWKGKRREAGRGNSGDHDDNDDDGDYEMTRER